MIRILLAIGLVAWMSPAPASAADPQGPFELVDGDRVVLIGGALIEQAQARSDLEAILTARHPDRSILFRNLGWSGDTVSGEARAGFGTPADGTRRLDEHIDAWKPTVALVGYGSVESFDGEPGLPRFRAGLDRLLDRLSGAGTRIVLLGPPRQEDLPRPLPDPSAHNRDLDLYREAIRDAARRRGARFVDLDAMLHGDSESAGPPLTDDGLQPNAYGYWRIATAVAADLGLLAPDEMIKVEADRRGARFRATCARLPIPPRPLEAPEAAPSRPARGGNLVVRVDGLAPGRYALKADGRPIARADAASWARGVRLEAGPDLEQAERLRRAIVAKNTLYFNRWRPQNETYLFGFRKKEQGQNAREIPLFDPLVAEAEAEIARLRVPVAHDYELVPEGAETP